jgi:hypothetical protein
MCCNLETCMFKVSIFHLPPIFKWTILHSLNTKYLNWIFWKSKIVDSTCAIFGPPWCAFTRYLFFHIIHIKTLLIHLLKIVQCNELKFDFSNVKHPHVHIFWHWHLHNLSIVANNKQILMKGMFIISKLASQCIFAQESHY